MKIKDLKNGQFYVSMKGIPDFITSSYNDALEIALKLGGISDGIN